jgi:hypothetical protein
MITCCGGIRVRNGHCPICGERWDDEEEQYINKVQDLKNKQNNYHREVKNKRKTSMKTSMSMVLILIIAISGSISMALEYEIPTVFEWNVQMANEKITSVKTNQFGTINVIETKCDNIDATIMYILTRTTKGKKTTQNETRIMGYECFIIITNTVFVIYPNGSFDQVINGSLNRGSFSIDMTNLSNYEFTDSGVVLMDKENGSVKFYKIERK